MFSTVVFFHYGLISDASLYSRAYMHLERVYFTYTFKKELLKGRVRIEAKEKEEPGPISFNFKVKDAYIERKGLVDLMVGYQPTFIGIYDSLWGYRLLYKDALSSFHFGSTRDMGVSVRNIPVSFAKISAMLSDAYAFGDSVFLGSASAMLEWEKFYLFLYGDTKLNMGAGPGRFFFEPTFGAIAGFSYRGTKILLLGSKHEERIGSSFAVVVPISRNASSDGEERGGGILKGIDVDYILRCDALSGSDMDLDSALVVTGVSFKSGKFSVVPNAVAKFYSESSPEWLLRMSMEWKLKS